MLQPLVISNSICGTRNLTSVKQLTIAIDSSRVALDNLPDFLPNLTTLTLDNSLISSLRDLGTNFDKLQTISLSNLKLIDIDGIGSLTNLRELRLSNNLICDVTPLAMHENLQILDLSKNKINDFEALNMLSTCDLLYSLDLRKNFIELTER